MSTKEWVDTILAFLPYVISITGFIIVSWANSNYVSKKQMSDILIQALLPLKEEIVTLKADAEKSKNLFHEFHLFKTEYKGDAALQNKQLEHIGEQLRGVSEQIKTVNNKIR